ncbi:MULTISPECIES: hypothetical protein [unclassified Rhodococcus (in: high G+C Gram-positive bacteria)]|uniref:hypothetical protein n=1 Tax=unclassified Rhodococcus (in: high G+C Gram-positive bacteria) TaxID=192944 RepID=UPI001E514CB7|nr:MULTISPECIES: hypothetical protein [unclassified Rhodococcus (in: high G+C Gram-positive bacteria)]
MTSSGPRGSSPLRRVSRGSIQSLVVTATALTWARLWRSRISYDASSNLIVCEAMRGGYARGGTCFGGAFLTGHALVDPRRRRAMLRHESVHADQWARHGFSFAIRYLVEEMRRPGAANRFEVEAGLGDGGYLTRGPS